LLSLNLEGFENLLGFLCLPQSLSLISFKPESF
jgi:hypothetical protein